MTFALFLLAASAPVSTAPLPDLELADLRGGFAIPGGLNVAIAIQSDTRVDGSLLLRTVYRIDQAAPELTVYAPAWTANPGATSEMSNAPPPQAGINVTFDRQNGPRIGPSGPPLTSLTVVGGGGQSGVGNAPPNTSPINLSPNAAPVRVPAGQLSLTSNGGGQQVHLQSDQLQVAHLVGNAIGTAIANTGSDRVIETATTVSLDIGGATPFNLGSSMLRVDTLATDATALMLPR